MAEQELLERLDRLHKENKNKDILREIAALPEEVRGEYAVQGRLARALGNLGELRKALDILKRTREEGKDDPLWWYRMGRCLFGLERYREARPYFEEALRLDPDDQDSRYLVGMCGLAFNKNRSGKGNKF